MNRPHATLQMPPQMSNFAADVDELYYLIYWISVISFVLIVGIMSLYVWKYRRRPGHSPEVAGHNTALEILWTFSPLIVLGYLFVEGFRGYAAMNLPPPDAIEIRVVASQWKWDFTHPNGATQTNELVIPMGRPVRMIMSSNDVLHSFYIPEFRVKRDVVPGMYSSLWFTATHETGNTPVTLFCAEYCGAPLGIRAPDARAEGHMIDNQNTNHSTMLASVDIVSPAEYDRQIADIVIRSQTPPPECTGESDPMACWGRQLYTQNCAACHAIEAGQQSAGPNWVGLFGSTRQFADGTSAEADENYIRESMLQPNARVAAGFNPIMPPQRLADKKIDAIIAFMRTLR